MAGEVTSLGSSLRDRFWLVPLLLFPLLAFPNLGSAYLWQDEGETAVLAQCVLLHGYPFAHDGRQVVSDQADQRDLKNGVWIWSPWLPIYTAAASFAVLGESTTTARLPFVLIAWVAALLSYGLFLELTGNRRVSRLACVLLLLSVPFLLHARQCRYYSILVLFTILHLWGYVRVVRGRRHGVALIAVAGAGLAQSFFPQLLASTAACGIHALWLARDRGVLRRFVTASAIAAAVSLPFFLYTAAWARDYNNEGHGYDSLARYMANLRSYALMAHVYGFPFLLGVPLAWRAIGKHWAARAKAARMALVVLTLACLAALGMAPGPVSFGLSWAVALVAAGIGAGALVRDRARDGAAADWRPLTGLVLVVSVVASAALSQYPFFRYVLGVLPLFALWTAHAVIELTRGNVPALVALTAVLAGTNLVSQGPWIALARTQGPPEPARSSWVDRVLAYGYRPSNIPSMNMSRFLTTEQPWSVSPLRDYLGEITHEYVGPVKAVVAELQMHGKPGQVLLTTYEHFPFMFYTDLLVLKLGQTAGQTTLPDWFYAHSPRMPRLPPDMAAAFGATYEPVRVNAKEVRWENIPEPYWHFYRTRTDGRDVALFRKRAAVTP